MFVLGEVDGVDLRRCSVSARRLGGQVASVSRQLELNLKTIGFRQQINGFSSNPAGRES